MSKRKIFKIMAGVLAALALIAIFYIVYAVRYLSQNRSLPKFDGIGLYTEEEYSLPELPWGSSRKQIQKILKAPLPDAPDRAQVIEDLWMDPVDIYAIEYGLVSVLAESDLSESETAMLVYGITPDSSGELIFRDDQLCGVRYIVKYVPQAEITGKDSIHFESLEDLENTRSKIYSVLCREYGEPVETREETSSDMVSEYVWRSESGQSSLVMRSVEKATQGEIAFTLASY